MKTTALRFTLCCSILLLATPASAQNLTPEEARDKMELPEGFSAKLFASEPEVRQPVSISFDERGRMWVVQYIQYPTPAGLEAVAVDEYLRTQYDKIPPPPPEGPVGADKITLLEDTDGDGTADVCKDFVTGLNLATGVEVGYGGVFVLQSPYLLFYPDKDRDDVPDSDPEVLLSGFGMEDAHAFPNSLIWGPDGWLYGAQGSTVTAHIRGIKFNQGIWRYHPITREFELFSEGGGNTWGLDFDRHGNALPGTNWGGFAMLHQVQGAYYIKNFGKHGELLNPHAYGYFDHVPYDSFQGGHVTCGNVIYHGGAFPDRFEGTFIAANILSNQIHWHLLTPDGSSFTAKLGGILLDSHDPWFRPIDCAVGPDGSVFVADWHDQRATHVDPKDDWDRRNGRIFKIESEGTERVSGLDLRKKSSAELVELLEHENHWYGRMARRLLGERRDSSVVEGLKQRLAGEIPTSATVDTLWALSVSGGLDDGFALEMLSHSNENVRAWTARLLGDRKSVTEAQAKRLAEMAATDSSPTVRSQLACTAKRLPAKDGLPIVAGLMHREEDVEDPFIPMLIWWAIEDKAVSDIEPVLSLFESEEDWTAPISRQFLIERLGRRYAAEGTIESFQVCARLLENAPNPACEKLLLEGMEAGLEGQDFEEVPEPFNRFIDQIKAKTDPGTPAIAFALRLGSPTAFAVASQRIADVAVPEADRLELIEILGQSGKEEIPDLMLTLLNPQESGRIHDAALGALERYGNEDLPSLVLEKYKDLPGGTQDRIRNLLASRKAWAERLLAEVEAGSIPPATVSLTTLRRIHLHGDKALNERMEKLWGKIEQETSGVLKGRIRGVTSILGLAEGDPSRGREVFAKNCAVCHKLFGEGNEVGPDLTGADRTNRTWLIENIVDPNSYVRTEYIAHVVETFDGRLLTGLMVESTPNTLTLVDSQNERISLDRDDIDMLRESQLSLMPVGLLDPLEPGQVQDLFSYLESGIQE
jgi:putative membrane-bound dehydrogenase-like protein